MCFSATADVTAGVIITVVGIDAVRHIRSPRQVPLGVLPLVLAAHQLTEAVVWWGLQGHVSRGYQTVAMASYLAVAFVVLPVYFPVAVLLVEPGRRRRTAMWILALIGAVVAVDLGAALLRGPVTAELCPFHISYGVDISAGWLVVAGYVLATCGAALMSSSRFLQAFGVLNLAAVGALALLERDGFASLWCAWAALASITIALQLRHPPPKASPSPDRTLGPRMMEGTSD